MDWKAEMLALIGIQYTLLKKEPSYIILQFKDLTPHSKIAGVTMYITIGMLRGDTLYYNPGGHVQSIWVSA